ncbi:MAG: hypothetical protein ACRDQ1_18775, partial [Sciscionella sp.]
MLALAESWVARRAEDLERTLSPGAINAQAAEEIGLDKAAENDVADDPDEYFALVESQAPSTESRMRGEAAAQLAAEIRYLGRGWLYSRVAHGVDEPRANDDLARLMLTIIGDLDLSTAALAELTDDRTDELARCLAFSLEQADSVADAVRHNPTLLYEARTAARTALGLGEDYAPTAGEMEAGRASPPGDLSRGERVIATQHRTGFPSWLRALVLGAIAGVGLAELTGHGPMIAVLAGGFAALALILGAVADVVVQTDRFDESTSARGPPARHPNAHSWVERIERSVLVGAAVATGAPIGAIVGTYLQHRFGGAALMVFASTGVFDRSSAGASDVGQGATGTVAPPSSGTPASTSRARRGPHRLFRALMMLVMPLVVLGGVLGLLPGSITAPGIAAPLVPTSRVRTVGDPTTPSAGQVHPLRYLVGAEHGTAGTVAAGLRTTFAELNAANQDRFTDPDQSVADQDVRLPVQQGAKAGEVTWSVRAGDSVWVIAGRFLLLPHYQILVEDNPWLRLHGRDPALIHPAEVLVIDGEPLPSITVPRAPEG